MKLAQLLSERNVLLDMKALAHREAIIELSELLLKSGDLPPEIYEETLISLQERESRISTGIGSGVAIPHAFSEHVDRVVAVLGRSLKGINFESLDEVPVKLIILFIVPSTDYPLHLRTLSAIAKLFTREEVRTSLLLANSYQEIIEILDPKPQK